MADDYKVETEIRIETKDSVKEAKKLAAAVKEVEKQRKKAEKAAEAASAAAARKFRAEQRAAEKAKQAAREALGAISGGLTGLGRKLTGTSLGLGRVVSGLVAMGATYIGVRAVTNSLRDFVEYAGRANASVETLTLSLGTVMSEIEGMNFGRARTEAHGLYRQIQDIAITSPGTARQVADVFTMAYGPMRRAGGAMDDILRLSQNTLSVASALRIDLPQVSRDISMMASGVAGTDVKTFRLLRSMGMITETAREWNQIALETPARTAERLMEIFEELGGPAAEAFGRTWEGVTSAFSDIFENFSRLFGGATFAVMRDSLRAVNDWLLRYRSNLENVMEFLGTRIAGVVQGTIDRVRDVGLSIANNMDMIVMKIDDFIVRVRELLPAFKAIAKGMVVFAVASRVLAPVLMGLGGVLSAVSGLAGLAGTFGVATGAGGAAAAAGGAGAAGAAGGGFAAIISAAGAALSTIIPIVLGVGAVLAAIGSVVWSTIRRVGDALWGAFEPVVSNLQEAGAAFFDLMIAGWEFVEPFLDAIGSILAVVVMPGLSAMAGALRGLAVGATIAAALLRAAADWLVPRIEQFSRALLAAARAIGDFVGGLFRMLGEIASTFGLHVPSLSLEGLTIAGGAGGREGLAFDIQQALAQVWGQPRAALRSTIGGRGGPPTERPTTNVDMRGSTINVRQEFREADPDRVWLQVREDMTREAIFRVQSGFVSPLTR